MYTDVSNRIYDLDLFRSRSIEHVTAAGAVRRVGLRERAGRRDLPPLRRRLRGRAVRPHHRRGWRPCARTRRRTPFRRALASRSRARSRSSRRRATSSARCPATARPSASGSGTRRASTGREVYGLLVAVMNENPALFDPNDFVPGQGEFIPEQLRVATWAHPEPGRLRQRAPEQAPRERLLRHGLERRHPQGEEGVEGQRLPRGDGRRPEPVERGLATSASW